MTEMSRERREEITRWIAGIDDHARPPAIHEISALLSDSAWRERAERQVREWANHLNGPGQYMAPAAIADELRAIVDTGRGEGSE